MIRIRDRNICGISVPLFLLITTSVLLLLWNLWSYHLNGDILYAQSFFEDVYILLLVTIFGFLLLTSSGMLNAASVAAHRSGIWKDTEREKHEEFGNNITNSSPEFCFWLFTLFIFSLSVWLMTLQAIQEHNTDKFYLYALICILLLIALIGITVYQIYATARLEEGNAKNKRDRDNNRGFFGM